MVLAICCALVLMPIGAVAATGSFVNITDPKYAARKARVDSSGRLSVSDEGTVTRTLVSALSIDCTGGTGYKEYVVDTSPYSSIRIVAYNFGPSQAILELSPAVNDALTYPFLWRHTMPAGTTSEVSQEITTPPPQTALRVNFCSPGFRVMMFGSR
jgi:hypothetical protein